MVDMCRQIVCIVCTRIKIYSSLARGKWKAETRDEARYNIVTNDEK